MVPSVAQSWISCCCGTAGVGGSSSSAPTARARPGSMHVVIDDLGLEHLWVVYPGDRASTS